MDDTAALKEQLEEQKRKVSFYLKAVTEKDEAIANLKKEMAKLQDNQSNLLFADDKDLANQLKKAQDENRELTQRMNKLKAEAKNKILELKGQVTNSENQLKAQNASAEEQRRMIEQLQLEVEEARKQAGGKGQEPKKEVGAGWEERGGWDGKDGWEAEEIEEPLPEETKQEEEKKDEVQESPKASPPDDGEVRRLRALVSELEAKVEQFKGQEEAFGKERDSFNELMQSLSEKVIRGEEELASAKADFARRKIDLEAQMIRLMENQAQESSQGGSLNEMKIKELEEELKNFEEVKRQAAALESQLLQKDQKFGALLEEKEGEIARLSKEMEETSHQLQLVAVEKDGKIKKLESQLQNALGHAETLQQDLVNLDSEAQAKLAGVTRELEALRQAAQNQQEGGEQEATELKAKLSELEAELAAKKTALEEASHQLEDFKKKAKKRLHVLQEEKESLLKECQALKEAQQAAAAGPAEPEAQGDSQKEQELAQKLGKAQEELLALQESYQASLVTREDLTSRLHEAEDRVKLLTNELVVAKAQPAEEAAPQVSSASLGAILRLFNLGEELVDDGPLAEKAISEKISAFEAEVRHLQEELDEQKSLRDESIKEFQNNLNQSASTLAALKEELSQLETVKTQLEGSERKVQELQAQLALGNDLGAEVQRLQTSLDELERKGREEAESQAKQLSTLQEELAFKSSQENGLHESLENAQAQIRLLNEELQQAQNNLHEKEGAAAEGQAQIQILQAQLSELQEGSATSTEGAERLTLELAAAKSQLASAEAQKISLEQASHLLKQELAAAQLQASQVQEEKVDLAQVVEQLKRELEAAQNQIQGLEGAKSADSQDIAEKLSRLRLLEDLVKSQEQEIQELNTRIQKLDASHQNQQAELLSKQREVEILQDQILGKAKQLLSFEQELTALQEEVKGKEQEHSNRLRELAEENKSKNKELSGLIDKGVELEGQLTAFRLKEKQKDEEISQLRQELTEKSSLFEKKKEELEQLKRDHEDEIERISNQLDASAGKLQKVQMDEMVLKQLQMRIEELTQDLDRFQHENQEKEHVIQDQQGRIDSLKEEQSQLSQEFELRQKKLLERYQTENHQLKEKDASYQEAIQNLQAANKLCQDYQNQISLLQERVQALEQTTPQTVPHETEELEIQNRALLEEITQHKTKIVKLEDKLQMTLSQQEMRNEEQRSSDLAKFQTIESKIKQDLQVALSENQQLRDRLRNKETELEAFIQREGSLASSSSSTRHRSSQEEYSSFAPFTLLDQPPSGLDLEGNGTLPPASRWRARVHSIGRSCDSASIRLTQLIKRNSIARVFGFLYFILLNFLMAYFLLISGR